MAGYVCRYCREPSEPASNACSLCGAPVAVRATSSGWMEQPSIRDMTRISCGTTRCQIAGTVVPVAEFSLGEGDWIYFAPAALLWTDTVTTLEDVLATYATGSRTSPGYQNAPDQADLPQVLFTAKGPGHIAVSESRAGELIAIPVPEYRHVRVRQQRFLCATGTLTYEYRYSTVHYRLSGALVYPAGKYYDTFATSGGQGLLLLHAAGNVFVRDLDPGDSILVKPSSLLYWDGSLRLDIHLEYVIQPDVYRTTWVRVTGPGRVAVESAHADDQEPLGTPDRSSFATMREWWPPRQHHDDPS